VSAAGTEPETSAAARRAESTPLSTRTLDRCLACGGTRLAPLPLAYEHRGARFPLVECRACGMRFLATQPTAEAYASLYDATYFESEFRCGRCDTTSDDEAAFVAENRGLLDAFAALGASGRLLDVGCAAGWLLKHAGERGWEARGVELSPAAVATARSHGLDVIQGDLIGARLPAASFDLVFMGDVLEHVPDCRAVLDEVARVLRPGGLLYLRGPITTHSLGRSLALGAYRWLGRTIVLREPPYHLWEFTPGPLARLARASGLEVVRMRQSKIPPGRARGEKSALQRAALAAIDAVNVPLTALFNARGDRIVMVARRP
jgi:SAM-dependent methyltransferase